MTYWEEVYDLSARDPLQLLHFSHPVIKRVIKRVIKYVIKQSIKERRQRAAAAGEWGHRKRHPHPPAQMDRQIERKKKLYILDQLIQVVRGDDAEAAMSKGLTCDHHSPPIEAIAPHITLAMIAVSRRHGLWRPCMGLIYPRCIVRPV